MSTPPAQPVGAYASQVLRPWSPLIASHRAPVEPGPRGTYRKGSGGVVTALLGVAEATGAGWVALARTAEERRRAQAAATVELPGGSGPITVHYAVPDPDAYHAYYSVIANPLLWFLQHYLWNLIEEPLIDDDMWAAWEQGYVAVNRMVAERVVEVARRQPRPPLLLTQDYQLYLVPQQVRSMLPEVLLQQFIHIPWPAANYWKVLPGPMREAIYEGLLGNDIVGFQTRHDVRNFLDCCEDLMGLRVDHRERAVLHRGRVIWARHYPISIDVTALQRLARSAAVQREVDRLRGPGRPEKLIVRVDRTDPSKNIVRGFLAYERLLRLHPEWIGRVQFFAFLQPSRQDIARYRRYLRLIRTTADRVNRVYGLPGWAPIRLQLKESLRRAVALYRDFDVLLVNPIYDGMNLVAKEGMAVNERGGVLVLSENAGAHEELGEWAETVNPFDVGATAEALHAALTAPKTARLQRQSSIRRQVAENDINRWLSHQLRDLRELPAG